MTMALATVTAISRMAKAKASRGRIGHTISKISAWIADRGVPLPASPARIAASIGAGPHIMCGQ